MPVPAHSGAGSHVLAAGVTFVWLPFAADRGKSDGTATGGDSNGSYTWTAFAALVMFSPCGTLRAQQQRHTVAVPRS